MDTLVFDIETQNFFTDPGVGWDNFLALKISAVGIYSCLTDRYACFTEMELKEAAELFRGAKKIVGFSINRFDVPVLNRYFEPFHDPELNLWEKERVDLLEEIEMAAGQRVSLSKLAEANLGEKKERHGSEAATLYRNGQIEELKSYCLNDVRLTRALYDLFRKQGYLLMPDKMSGEIIRVEFKKPFTYATLF